MKKVPSYWWDFDHETSCVIVQSDGVGGGRLAEFWYPEDGPAEAAIKSAEELIADFNAGRKTPKWNKRHAP